MLIWIGLALILVGGGMAAVVREKRLIGGGIGAAGVVALVFSCLAIVPAGHVGVPVVFGDVSDESLPQGLNLKNPFAVVYMMSVRTENYTMSKTVGEGQVRGDDSVRVLSKDGLQMPIDVSVLYRLNADDAPWVYERFGPDFNERIIRPSIRTAVRVAGSRFMATEAYASKREDFAMEIQQQLEKSIKTVIRDYEEDAGGVNTVIVQQVLLRDVGLPPRVQGAIEEKLAAEQEAQKMEFVLAKESKEKERKKIEAEGIRDFQQTVQEGITPDLLRWKGIEATMDLAASPNAKIVVIGSGKDGLPLILGGDSK